MLEHLKVQNFALIDNINLDFSPGLNVFTGETGAGKSILLGALSVLLGERILDEFYRTPNSVLQVQGTLDVSSLKLPDWVQPEDGLLIISRQAQKGKRALNYVNNQQTTQAALADLGNFLVDIHGQHQHQSLLKPSTHGQFLDAYGNLSDLKKNYLDTYTDYHLLLKKINNLTHNLQKRKTEKDFLEFQLAEIENSGLKEGEAEVLRREQELLASAEKRAEIVSKLIELISENDGAILENLSVAAHNLDKLVELDSSLSNTSETLQQAAVSVEELWRTLLSYRDKIDYSSQRLEEINERLFSLEKLFRKYNTDEKGLLRIAKELSSELSFIDIDEHEIERLNENRKKLRKKLLKLAEELSNARKQVKRDFQNQVETYLNALAMPNASLVVKLTETPDENGIFEKDDLRYKLTENGLEEIQFMFSANLGEEPKPLARIASGGELSRIMLALKTALLDSDKVPVLVFDEIDVGIGGKTAETVGKRLKELSKTKQILLVTHLHQIARYADAHFQVSKREENARTVTEIIRLNEDARVKELARMLGGEKITDTIIAHAKELLDNSQ